MQIHSVGIDLGKTTFHLVALGAAGNLIPIMVFNDRPTCKDRHAAELIMARRDVLHSKAEYIAADLSIAQTFFLAVLRRTIHWRYSCPKVRTAIRIRWSILLAVMARCDG